MWSHMAVPAVGSLSNGHLLAPVKLRVAELSAHICPIPHSFVSSANTRYLRALLV